METSPPSAVLQLAADMSPRNRNAPVATNEWTNAAAYVEGAVSAEPTVMMIRLSSRLVM